MGCPHYFLKNTISHCDTLLFGKTNKMQSQLFVYKLCDPFPPIPFLFHQLCTRWSSQQNFSTCCFAWKTVGKKAAVAEASSVFYYVTCWYGGELLGCHTVYELSMRHSELNFNKYLPENNFFAWHIHSLVFLFERHTKRMLIFGGHFSFRIEILDQCVPQKFSIEKRLGVVLSLFVCHMRSIKGFKNLFHYNVCLHTISKVE